jgi:hypothetical protein
MDTKAVVARFEAERQALALMDHPNIARVLDGGATRTGRPYFVMELVRGVPFTKFCDEQELGVDARLQLFIRVCAAVQHAHQKGIIHRDLKPANILVTLDETGAVPKVIDFGIAKATQGRLVAATLMTAFDQMIGTPAYMCPEQAAPNLLDVDTRCDVYSLGVLLYELLAGRLPFEAQAYSQASREEIRRLICDVEPPRPSRRLAALLPAEAAEVARRRSSEVPALVARLAGDLDWIVMRALEKNRVRRYDTPSALAADLTRHLQHEAVTARPPTTAYRLGKLIRRNRLTFAAVAAVGLALFAGLIASITLTVRARRAEHVAAEERARADWLVGFMLTELPDPLDKISQLPLLEKVAVETTNYLGSFKLEEMNDATLAQHVLALNQLGTLRVLQVKYDEAEAAYASANARAVRLVEHRPADAAALYSRGQAEYGLGNVWFRRNDHATARRWFEQYRDTARLLMQREPGGSRGEREMAYAEHNLAAVAPDPKSSREGFLAGLPRLRRIVASLPDDHTMRSSLANTYSFLGSRAEEAGELVDALRQFSESVDQYAVLCQREADRPRWRFKLADSLCFQANVLAITGGREAAARALARAHELMEALSSHDPTNSQWKNTLVVAHLREAMLAKAAGDRARAAERLADARAGAEALVAAEPKDSRFPYRLATALRLEAELQFATDGAQARRSLQRAMETGEKLNQRANAKAEHRAERAHAAILAGRFAAADGDLAQAQAEWQHAHKLLAARPDESKDWRVLDPAVRVATLLGAVDEAQALRARLDACGYVPLEPWPEPTVSPRSETKVQK